MRQSVSWRRQNGGAVLWILVWLVGMAAILYFCLTYDWSSSQSKLQQNVTAAIAPMSATATAVTISDGRDVTLEGMSGSEEEQQQLIDTVAKVPGVRSVLNTMNSSTTGGNTANTESALVADAAASPEAEADSEPKSDPTAEPAPVLADSSLHLISNNDTVTLSGQIKDQQTASTLTGAVKQAWPDSDIDSQLTIDPNTNEASWLDPVVESLPQIAQLDEGELHIADNKAELKGRTSDAVNALSIMQSLKQNLTDSIELVDSTEPAPEPVVPEPMVTESIAAEPIAPESIEVQATKSEEEAPASSPTGEPTVDIALKDDTLQLNGTLSSPSELARVVGSAIASFNPTTVENNIVVDESVAAANWIAPLSNTLNSAKSSDEFSIQIDSAQVSVSGSAQNEEVAASIDRVVKREFKDDLEITNTLSVAAPEASAQPEPIAPEPIAPEPVAPESVTPVSVTPVSAAEEPEQTDTENNAAEEDFASKIESINTRGILFQSARDVITADSRGVLDDIVALLAAYPEQAVTIAGYTDSSGAAEANRTLSQARADAVKAYLVEKGITESRLRAFGYGEAAPIADNTTSEGRALNRRIEFNY